MSFPGVLLDFASKACKYGVVQHSWVTVNFGIHINELELLPGFESGDDLQGVSGFPNPSHPSDIEAPGAAVSHGVG